MEEDDHLNKAFGSNFDNEMQEEVQKINDNQSLSPRGQKKKMTRTNQNTTNNPSTVDKIKTRSQAKSSDD